MRLTLVALVAACAFGAVGCYDFASPLDPTPQLAVEEKLLGRWRCLDAEPTETDQSMIVTFSKTGERTYDVTFPKDDGTEMEHLHAYSSRLDDDTILNVRHPESGKSKPWTLVRYSCLLPNLLRLELVNDDIVKDDSSPDALRRELRRRRGAADLYEDVLVCVRIVERKPHD